MRLVCETDSLCTVRVHFHGSFQFSFFLCLSCCPTIKGWAVITKFLSHSCGVFLCVSIWPPGQLSPSPFPACVSSTQTYLFFCPPVVIVPGFLRVSADFKTINMCFSSWNKQIYCIQWSVFKWTKYSNLQWGKKASFLVRRPTWKGGPSWLCRALISCFILLRPFWLPDKVAKHDV